MLDASERTSQAIGADVGVGLAARFPGQQIYGDERVLLACDVDLLNEGELAASAGIPGLSGAALLAALYQRFGTGFIEKMR